MIAAASAEAAAAKAVEMALAGTVDALMKGALHTDVLMHAVVAGERNLRTERRISHVFVMDVPAYPRPLLITDAAINIYPDLETKRDIVQNAIDLAHALGNRNAEGRDPVGGRDGHAEDPFDPGRRRLSARWRTAARSPAASSTARWPSTMPCRPMPRRPSTSSRRSPARPTSWSCRTSKPATCWPRQLEYLAGADGAGIVLGARVPIILTSRADKTLSRMASCAVAMLLVHHAAGDRDDDGHPGPQCRLVEHQVRALSGR